ncbi:MAG: hypothetical protein R6W82_03310 [bacterium]
MHRRLIRVMRGSAAALLLLASVTAAQAQDRVQDDPMALSLKEKAAPTLDRATAAAAVIDRAIAFLDLSNLEIETYNYGPVTGEEYGSSYTFANTNGTRFNYVWDNHFLFGAESGPTISTGIVHDTYYHNSARHDWEALDGSRGTLMADPPQTTAGNFPMFAHSDLPATMPPSGWPAPSVTETWLGTETWDKWAVAGDRSTYGVFYDKYAYREDDTQSEELGITVRVRGITYASQNVIFFQYEIENTSSNTYTGVYLGNLVDSGGPTTGSDWAEASMVYDESMGMIYARQSQDAGYDPSSGTMTGDDGRPLGFVAHLFLESPLGDFKRDGSGTYVNSPEDVLSRVALLAYPDFTDPTTYSEDEFYGAVAADLSKMGNTQANDIWKAADNAGAPILEQTQADMLLRYTDEEDPMFYAGAGPFTMAPNEKFDYVIAAVGGFDEAGLYAEAQKAINTYNAKFAGPGPPQPPTGFVANGVLAGPEGKDFNPVNHDYRTYYTPAGEITLSFDLSKTLNTPDALSGIQDFEGIRIYRSTDRGDTWGDINFDSSGNPDGWFPYAQFDLANDITGEDAFTNTNLGEDTGIVTTWTDPNTLDGIEYWYAITVYDRGEYDATGKQVLRSLETPIGSDPNNPTVLAAISGSQPNGYVAGGLGGVGERASSINLLHEGETRPHKSAAWVEVRSEPALTGDDYEIVFTDYFVDPQGDTTSTELLTGGWGSERTASGVTLNSTTSTTTLFEALEPGRENLDWANLPVTDGMRIFVKDPNDGNYGVHRFQQAPGASYTFYTYYSGPKGLAGQPDQSLERVIANDATWDFEFVWSDTAADGSLNKAIAAGDRVVANAPFEVWRTDTGERVWPIITQWFQADPNWSNAYERVIITDVPYDTDFFDTSLYPNHDPADPDYWAWWAEDDLSTQSDWLWFFELSQWSPDLWTHGETWTAEIYRPIASDVTNGTSSLSFTTTASDIDQAETTLDNVTVVPNPYYVFAEWDQNENNRKIQFRNVPPNSTVDIYTVSGELVASLEHGDEYNSTKIGTVEWNIWTYEFTEAVYGLYVYVVKTADGQKKVGKFAIIR